MAKQYDLIKVGKNQITFIDNLWVIEVFEHLDVFDNKTPMYSVWDATPSKKIALKYAKMVNNRTAYGLLHDKFVAENEKLKKRGIING